MLRQRFLSLQSDGSSEGVSRSATEGTGRHTSPASLLSWCQAALCGVLERYSQAQPVSSGSDEIVPWTLIPGVPAQAGEHALTQEAFCGVLAEVSLEAADIKAFLAESVEFANETIWGNLSCTLLIDSATQRRFAAELEAAIANLRYGAIGVNVWSAVLYSFPVFPWGAFPGNSRKISALARDLFTTPSCSSIPKNPCCVRHFGLFLRLSGSPAAEICWN